MSMGWGSGVMPEKMSEKVLSCQEAADCLIPMGMTSENVAEQYNISRDVQDTFAANSYAKALRAQKDGKFRSEIVPVKVGPPSGLYSREGDADERQPGHQVKVVDPKSGEEKEMIVDTDDGIRDGVTAQSLSKIKPAFKKDGATHAGNASQVSDGAAAVLLARRSVAKQLGLPILGKFVISTVVGVPPKIMGVGPAYAIPKVLAKAGISKEDVDLYEINEAFASQAVMSIQHIGLPYEKVNPVGGAIAFG